VTHFGLLHWLRRAVRREPTPASLTKIAWMAVLRYARGIALTGALTSLAVAGVVEVLRWRASPLAKVSVVRQALDSERAMKRTLDEAHPYWFGAAAVLLTSALGIYTYRRRHAQCTAAFAALQQAEIDRLVRAMNEDPKWWDLAPNEDMKRVINRIVEIQHQIPRLPTHVVPSAEQAIDQLKTTLIQLDLVRRMNLKLEPDAVEEPEPETWREWISSLLGSRRVVGSTRAGTRLLYRFNALLLVFGLIGFQSVAVNGVIQDRLVALSDLDVRLGNLEAIGQEVVQAEADAKEEAPAPRGEAQSSSTSSSPSAATQSARMTERAASLKHEVEKARSTRPSYTSEDEAAKQLALEADQRAARAKAMANLDEEIRRASAGPEEGGRPGAAAANKLTEEGDRLANLRERLDRLGANAGPEGSLKPKADALTGRLAAADPDASLRTLDGEAATVDVEARKLRSAVESRPRTLEERLRAVGQLDGHADEIANLSRRIDRLRADTGGRYDRVLKELTGIREEIAAEKSRVANDLSGRRKYAADLSTRVDQIDQGEAVLPAKLDESRARLSSAEARAGWERARPVASGAEATLTPADDAAAKLLARAYEESLGEKMATREVIAMPDAEASAKLRALATRNEILDQARRVAPSERFRPPIPSEVPNLSDVQRKMLSSAESIFRSEAPRTAPGQAMYDQLVREMRLAPGFREQVIAQAPRVRARLLAGSGLAPRAPPSGRLLSELSLTAFESAVDRVAGPTAADAFGEIARSTLINYEKACRYEFMRDLAGGESKLSDALERFAAREAKAPLPGTGRQYLRQVSIGPSTARETVSAVAAYEPAIEVPFERSVNLEKAGAIVMEQGRHGAPDVARSVTRTFTEAMESYADTFPAQPGIERVTPRGQILEALERQAAAAKEVGAESRLLASLPGEKLSEWSAGRSIAAADSLIKEGRIKLLGTPLQPSALSGAERARSFFRLHSSPRVGGVLIGRKPRAGVPSDVSLDLSDLRWEIGARDVRLTLVGRDGSQRRSRPFRRDLTELALAYTADGRPTVVTIIHSQPLRDRRVLLHPALVDTAAGKAIARTDLIIFRLIEHEPWYVDAYVAVLNQVELYRRAWAIRQSVLNSLGTLKPEYAKTIDGYLNVAAVAARPAAPRQGDAGSEEKSAIEFMSMETDKDGVVAALTSTLRNPEAIRDAARSPLTVKTAYFDKELVDDILIAAGPGRSLVDFDDSVRKASFRHLGNLADWLRERDARDRALAAKLDSFKARAQGPVADRDEYNKLESERVSLKAEYDAYQASEKSNEDRLNRYFRRWTMPVPEVAHVSGIREREFTKTAADCFVPEGAATPDVLDFLIQITYDSAPYFLNGDPPAHDDKAAWQALGAYADEAPWEFPAIAERVRQIVARALKDDPSMVGDREAVSTLAEFTMLQRLFRLGLAGELGSGFPVERLAVLHRNAAPATAPTPVRTPRWDSQPGRLERYLKDYVDRELMVLNPKDTGSPLRAAVEPGVKAIAALAQEYAARAAERDQALDSAEGGPGSSSWNTTWDSFQRWAVEWEDRLSKASVDLERSAESVDAPVKERAQEISRRIRWWASAIALRRALDVNTDDKLARAARPIPARRSAA
jgi:hypothetical protein